jgi:hypothetical protein
MSRRERVLRDQSDSLREQIGPGNGEFLAVMDIESNGLSHSTYPLEVGYAFGTGAEPFCTGSMLVRPRPEWDRTSIDQARHIHGIRPDQLENALEADEVCDHLDRVLGGMTVRTDGGDYDRYWLARLYEGRVPAFDLAVDTDTMASFEGLRSGMTSVHRAGPDAVWIYRAMRIATMEQEQ